MDATLSHEITVHYDGLEYRKRSGGEQKKSDSPMHHGTLKPQ